MLTPSNRSITITAGGTALVGRTTAIAPPVQAGAPAWLTSANPTIGQWIEIPGTTVVRRQVAESYSGMVTTPNGKIIVANSGGHDDGAFPFVDGIDLAQNTPTWASLKATATSYIPEQPYVQSGEPSARHSYYSPQYVPALDAVMMTGCYSVPTNSGSSFPTIDAFFLATNQWSAPEQFGFADYPRGTYAKNSNGTYPANGNNSFYPGYSGGMLSSNMIDSSGYIWAGPQWRFDPIAKVWTQAGTLASGVDSTTDVPRNPWAHDSVRNESFAMCFGDGQGYSASLGLVAVRRKAGLVQKVTFNSSAAVTAYITEAPAYCAMTFNPVTGWYYHYSGNSSGNGSANRVYVIKPNSGLVWDMELLITTGAIACHSSGIQNRFQYIAALGGIVYVPLTGRGVFFLRTQ